MLPKNVLYYGVDQPLPARIPLRAGPLNLFFENGDLRHIRFGEHEILRRVYVAVRDRNWGTVTPQISNLQINTNERDVQITFDTTCRQNEIDFHWQGKITGNADGTIIFSMDGTAHSEFWRNRIGFCVLHPIDECAGQPCEIEHSDGSREQGEFPQFISPHQPFMEIRAINHEVVPGLRAEVRMTGDTFEMEDQRNWTDASFKTYCTPLEFQFPVLVKKGEWVQQTVQLKLEGLDVRGHVLRDEEQPLTVFLTPKPQTPIPSIGLCLASHKQPLSLREIDRLSALNLAHLRVDLWMVSRDGWKSELQRGVGEAQALNCALEIALHLTSNAEIELSEVLSALKEAQPRIARWIIFHVDETSTSSQWVALAQKILTEFDASIPVGCGADSNFTELNRKPPGHLPPNSLTPDFLSYAANPQVHAFDNLSLAENLAGLGETVISAQKLSEGKPVIISPVTLKPRFNVVAIGEENGTDFDTLPALVDPRQMSLFGAGWTLGAIKYLAENGVSSATFYETTSWRGVMETERNSPLPQQFRSIPGVVFPLYHIFADVGEFTGGQVIPSKSSNPLKVESLALRKDDQTRVLIANLTGTSSQILVANIPERVQIKTLDEDNALDALQSPEKFNQQPGQILVSEDSCLNLEIKPYAIVCIDIKGA